MSVSHAKRCLYEIGKCQPMLLGLMKKEIGDSTVGQQWAEVLAGCDENHLKDVCKEIADGERELVPERVSDDRMVFYIKQEVKRREDRDRARDESAEIRKLARRSGSEDCRNTVVERFFTDWGPFSEAIVDEVILTYQRDSKLPEWSERFIPIRAEQLQTDGWKEANRIPGDEGHRVRREFTTDAVRQAKQD